MTRRTRQYIVTINNILDWKRWINSTYETGDFKYVGGQLEKGENGTEHLQAFLWLHEAKTVTAMKKYSQTAHFEPVYVNNSASTYQLKEETRVEGPMELGERPKSKKEAGKKGAEAQKEKNRAILDMGIVTAVEEGLIRFQDLVRVKQGIDMYKLLKNGSNQTEEARGIWYYGESGAGKSHTARTTYPGAFIKPQSKWWDGYTGQDAVILEDFDKMGACLGHYLKIWADKWSCTGEVKGGTVPLKYQKFIITSQYLPDLS